MEYQNNNYKANETAIHARMGKYIYLFEEIYCEHDDYACDALITWIKEIIETADELYDKDLQYNALLMYEFGLWCARVKYLDFTVSEIMSYVVEVL